MSINAIDTSFREEIPEVGSGASPDMFLKLKLLEEYLAIVSSYLQTVNDNYRKAAEQDRDNERAVEAKKAAAKGNAQAQMEEIPRTDKERASGNSFVAKESASSATTSGSAGRASGSPPTGIGPSYA